MDVGREAHLAGGNAVAFSGVSTQGSAPLAVVHHSSNAGGKEMYWCREDLASAQLYISGEEDIKVSEGFCKYQMVRNGGARKILFSMLRLRNGSLTYQRHTDHRPPRHCREKLTMTAPRHIGVLMTLAVEGWCKRNVAEEVTQAVYRKRSKAPPSLSRLRQSYRRAQKQRGSRSGRRLNHVVRRVQQRTKSTTKLGARPRRSKENAVAIVRICFTRER